MKKRFGMCLIIICILVVGVSVTKLTGDYVSSQGFSPIAFFLVNDGSGHNTTGAVAMDSAMPNPMAAAGASMNAVTEQMLDGAANEAPAEPEFAPPSESVAAAAVLETVAETAAYCPSVEVPAADVIVEMGPGDFDYAAEEEAAEKEAAAPEADMGTGDMELYVAGEDLEVSALEEAEVEPRSMKSANSVKSPLDPAPASQESYLEETVRHTAGYYLERFQTAEDQEKMFSKNMTVEHAGAMLAAAEQQKVLWEYELNLLYHELQTRMTAEEADALKILELEWIKERDLYAEKMASKSGKAGAGTQNPAYVRAQADKTKERCYWLVAEYEELLNQESHETAK